MEVNQIFYENDYKKAYDYVVEHENTTIVEIEADKNGRRFQLQEIPALTEKEKAQIEMQNLKQQLADMDYKTSKYVDGEYTDEEWAEIVAMRKKIRTRIRELEEQK